MVEKPGNMSRLVIAVVLGVLFTACGGGPGGSGDSSDAEFVAACMKEGQGGASQMLDKELGVTRDVFCKCGAPIAKSSLSADGYRAMILDMEGKREEASSITAKMSESEQLASLEVLGKMIEKCGGAAQ